MPLDCTYNPTVEVIVGVISYLERNGWIQGKAVDGAGRCVWGAMREIAGYNPTLVVQTQRHFERVNAIPYENITLWNDEPGRTKEEVIAALEKCL